MEIKIDVSVNELWEVYQKNYRDCKLIRKIILQLEEVMEERKSETEELEQLCDEFKFSPNIEDDPEAFENEGE